MNGQQWGRSPKNFSERMLEMLFGLLILGVVVQLVISVIRPYIPYALVGLVVLGIGTLIYKRKSNW